MPTGRPREVTPPDDELHILGEELVKWAKNDHANPPHTRMAQFYSLEKSIIRKDWKAIIQVPAFLPYYEKAKALLAARVMNTDVMHQSFGHRFIRLYDRDLCEEEDSQVKMKAELTRRKDDEESSASAREIAQAISEALNRS